ncbi:hypothetical protein L210DRAFT_3416995 [Boletus edulis BED1]|uniref:Uncharacterized protein n=1 Tax=Boletus edulis BED1 TaxID=1328754 RepID=A0AAD4BHU5_BOLED|nr:hypothetical protein L210DRAFT_3416995 [Boletus edulis BED1]
MAAPIQIPLRGTSNVPKFDGKQPSELPRYLEDIKFLGNAAHIDQAGKIKAAIQYVALDEAEVWQTLAETTAIPADWTTFIMAVKNMYPGCEGTNHYSRGDVQYLVQDHQRKSMRNQDDLGEYTRALLKIAAALITNNKLITTERNMLYLNRFPHALQQKIREHLLIIKQDIHLDDPYPMDDVTMVAKFLLTRSALPLRAIKAKVGGTRRTLWGIMDSGSEIVAMPKCIWEEIGLPIRSDHTMKMSLANTSIDMMIGVLKNLILDVSAGEVMVQMQVLARANFDLLLGQLFHCLMSAATEDFPDGSQMITLRDPNMGKQFALPM